MSNAIPSRRYAVPEGNSLDGHAGARIPRRLAFCAAAAYARFMPDETNCTETHPGFLSTELANTITHGIGLAASIAGIAVLVVMASLRGGVYHIVACSIYGATLVFLYLVSTLYHGVRPPRVKRVLRILDHAGIYLLIAGSYTPFTLVTLRGGWGWSTFGVAWGLAILGIIFKIFFTGRWGALSVVLYLIMGWLCALIVKPLLETLPMAAIWWLLAGGLFYTVGIVFYAWKKLPHHHAIWHLFVMAGSTCHFFSVMFFVLPRPV